MSSLTTTYNKQRPLNFIKEITEHQMKKLRLEFEQKKSSGKRATGTTMEKSIQGHLILNDEYIPIVQCLKFLYILSVNNLKFKGHIESINIIY